MLQGGRPAQHVELANIATKEVSTMQRQSGDKDSRDQRRLHVACGGVRDHLFECKHATYCCSTYAQKSRKYLICLIWGSRGRRNPSAPNEAGGDGGVLIHGGGNDSKAEKAVDRGASATLDTGLIETGQPIVASTGDPSIFIS